MITFLILWIVSGIIGLILRLFNPCTYPSKKSLWLVMIFTHIIFGFIGLIYGYICFSSRCKQSKDDLKPEYDFAKMKGGVRGKYTQR